MNSKELDKLEKELPKVSRQSRLYKIVSDSVKKWGNWKNKDRGKKNSHYWDNRRGGE
jgi:hypothetical protein